MNLHFITLKIMLMMMMTMLMMTIKRMDEIYFYMPTVIFMYFIYFFYFLNLVITRHNFKHFFPFCVYFCAFTVLHSYYYYFSFSLSLCLSLPIYIYCQIKVTWLLSNNNYGKKNVQRANIMEEHDVKFLITRL